MVGRGCQLDFFGPHCSFHASQSYVFIIGLILVYNTTFFSQVQGSSVKSRSANLSPKYQHCKIRPDGVRDLDCFGVQRSVKTCVWKPGNHTSEKTYTLIIRQQSKNYRYVYYNISGISKNEIPIHGKYNMTAEVLEHSKSTNCTKAVFAGSPKSMLRCGLPNNMSFRRHAGGLEVNVSCPKVDMKIITNYSVRYKALGSLLWSKSQEQCERGKQCTVKNLNSSLVYTVQIQCISDQCSQHAWSEAYTVPSELTTRPVIASLADTDIAQERGKRLLVLTWKFPAIQLHDGYRVAVGKTSGESPCELIKTTQPEIQLILSYSAYNVSIRAVNNVSSSPAVSQMIAQREVGPSLETGKLSVTVHSNRSFTIYWTDDLIKNYSCYCAEWIHRGHKAAYMSFFQSMNNNRKLSSLRETLEPYKRYSITLHTRPDKGTCNMKYINNSESTYGRTQFYFIEGSPVSAPANISSDNVTLNSMVLQWSSIPEEDIRGFLLGYIIHFSEYGHRGTNTERNITVDPVLNSYELRDLKSGTAYEVQVSGFTRAGAGVRSPSSLFKTNYQGFSNLSVIIAVFAVVATVLIFGPMILKRAQVILWPSIPNPGNSNAVQKLEGPCELIFVSAIQVNGEDISNTSPSSQRHVTLELLQSINTLKVEEWDANSLQLVEREVVIPASPLPSVLPLLDASEDEEDVAMTCDWNQRDTEDDDGDSPDITEETLSDIQRTNHQAVPPAFFSGYTTMEMFQQGNPQGLPANTSVTQEIKLETNLTGVNSPFDYIRQFSTSPTFDSHEMPMSPFMVTVWNTPAEHEQPAAQDQNNYCP